MKRIIVFMLIFFATRIMAQQGLPNFSVTMLNEEKARISWINPFSNCTQITIQKSYDSLKHFKTIFSSLSPELPENGYVDNDFIPQIKVYYRILYVIDDANYAFTKSKTAFKKELNFVEKKTEPENIRLITITKKNEEKDNGVNKANEIYPSQKIKIQLLDSFQIKASEKKKLFIVYKRTTDSLFNVLNEVAFSKFKDSIILKTKDTLYAYENDIFVWRPFIPEPSWSASEFIYTSPKGFLVINIPNFKKNKYRIIFYDDNKNEVMRIKHVTSEKFFLEKSNFSQAGWYSFELYEEDKLKEKNKFLLTADY